MKTVLKAILLSCLLINGLAGSLHSAPIYGADGSRTSSRVEELDSYTQATLPNPDPLRPGRLARVTDGITGLVLDDGVAWRALHYIGRTYTNLLPGVGATPTDIGLQFWGNNTSGTRKVFAALHGEIESNTAGAEKGRLHFLVNDTDFLQVIGTVNADGAWILGPGIGSYKADIAGVQVNNGVAGDGAVFGERLAAVDPDYDDARPFAIRNVKVANLTSLDYRAGIGFSILNTATKERPVLQMRGKYRTRTASSENSVAFWSLLRNGAEKDVYTLYDVGASALVDPASSTGGSETTTTLFPTDIAGLAGGRAALIGTGGNALSLLVDDTTPTASGNGPGGVMFAARTTDGTGASGRTPVAQVRGVKRTATSGVLSGEIRLQTAATAGGTMTDRLIIQDDTTVIGRLKTTATALVAGDIALSAGWGTTATVSAISGTDQRFKFTVTSAGTGQNANPTATLTFKDGTWTTSPFAVCSRNGGNQVTVLPTWTTSATQLILTFPGTPVAAETYTVECVVMG